VTGYRIRLARAAEAERLGPLEQAAAQRFAGVGLAQIAGGRPASSDGYLDAIAAGLIWVAERPGGALAIAGVKDGQGYLAEVSVHPEDAGQRLGAALIDTVSGWARGESYAGLTLTTFDGVPWNRPYYQRLGFRVLAEAEIGAELAEVWRQEKTRGLDALSPRVAMIKDL
jgi:GNAT superfamily N-acetyltransferase